MLSNEYTNWFTFNKVVIIHSIYKNMHKRQIKQIHRQHKVCKINSSIIINMVICDYCHSAGMRVFKIRFLAWKKYHFYQFCQSLKEFEYPELMIDIVVLATVNIKEG